MNRILALDVGDKRVGMAVSDALGITAQPLGVLVRDKNCWAAIERIVREHQVTQVLIGLPRNMDGSLGEQAGKTQEFALSLKKEIPGVEVLFRDERLTTAASERLLISAGVRREKRKSHRDAIAAALLLQSYLDQKSFERQRASNPE